MIGGKYINLVSEDNLVNLRKYMETIYLDYGTPSCPIMVCGSDEIFSIWLILQVIESIIEAKADVYVCVTLLLACLL